ncbi:1,4-benzoquinone reductase [Multifurca ochricompacta]|uniref:1,4-benzoquinone reductase n=1 Tax=Multifurca ochricompacta TaxID=376703 RepID=A0AAD4QJ91_9AGAM|nr:1,4-benzoquinone reductase [Multifurca ochricompacta]
MAPKIAIVIYTTFGHVAKLAEAEKKGIEAAGGQATIYQIAETLSEDVLLAQFDGVLYGIPTRFGNFPAQWKTFWDATSPLWIYGSLYGKFAGVFISTSSHGGGQESTALATISTFTHHGISFVPFGYAHSFSKLTNLTEVHGGALPWGAGTFSGSDGSRQPTALELEIAEIQGKAFYVHVAKSSQK